MSVVPCRVHQHGWWTRERGAHGIDDPRRERHDRRVSIGYRLRNAPVFARRRHGRERRVAEVADVQRRVRAAKREYAVRDRLACGGREGDTDGRNRDLALLVQVIRHRRDDVLRVRGARREAGWADPTSEVIRRRIMSRIPSCVPQDPVRAPAMRERGHAKGLVRDDEVGREDEVVRALCPALELIEGARRVQNIPPCQKRTQSRT
jgi:hypothetical protein